MTASWRERIWSSLKVVVVTGARFQPARTTTAEPYPDPPAGTTAISVLAVLSEDDRPVEMKAWQRRLIVSE